MKISILFAIQLRMFGAALLRKAAAQLTAPSRLAGVCRLCSHVLGFFIPRRSPEHHGYRSLIWSAYVMSLLALTPDLAYAADITLNLQVESRNQFVTVRVSNTGRDPARDLMLRLELDGEQYRTEMIPELPASQEARQEITVRLPREPGTYPIFSTLSYLNDSTRLSLVNVGYFNYLTQNILPESCSVPVLEVGRETRHEIKFNPALPFRLVLPDEIVYEPVKKRPDGAIFKLKNTAPGLTSNYGVYAVQETAEGVTPHGATICTGRLVTTGVMERAYFIPSWAIAVFFVFGGVGGFLAFRKSLSNGFQQRSVVVARYCFSVAVVSALYLVYRHLHEFTSPLIPWLQSMELYSTKLSYLRNIALILLRWTYFEGGDYDYFFRYIADPLYCYMVLANWFVLWRYVQPNVETDKYWHLLTRIYTLPGLRRLLPERGASAHFEKRRANCAVLAVTVKAFYLPMLCTWTINQVLYITGHLAVFTPNFQSFNLLATNALILIDVSIFAFGYLTELPRLRNQIRSVEPTLLGWAVCLWCYPPFNKFTFAPFDIPLNDVWTPSTGAAAACATAVITLLWGIYTWASVALAWRASNLTNRGIVSWGPYAYVRHPAYISKVTLWCISSFFFAQYNFYLTLAFIVIYGLRAYTEERHLSMDPDYVRYKEKVRWCFVPGLF